MRKNTMHRALNLQVALKKNEAGAHQEIILRASTEFVPKSKPTQIF